jgi:hypothetical protein
MVKDHDASRIRRVNSKELIIRLRQLAERLGLDVKSTRCPCFIDCNVDRTQPRFLHPLKAQQVSTCINDRNIHRHADFMGFFPAAATMLFASFKVIVM